MDVPGKRGSEEASADRLRGALALNDPVVPMVEVENLRAGYGTIVALRDVSLIVNRGEMMAVVGPNGSGKSTLLRVLSGVLVPMAGSIRVAGRELAAYPRRRLARMTAVVPQETSTDFSFSIEEVVLMGRAPHLGRLGFPGEHDLSVAREAMARMGVEHLCGRGLQEISGGERQRVIIARALVQEPEILLLDEPTSHLDIRHQVEIYDLMAELNAERGITVMSVLHDLNLAAMYFRRVAVLSEGTVHSIGPSAEVLTYKTIKAVYGTEVYVALNEVTGAVNILPLSRPYRERLRLEPRPA
jgi:iron complex transport system ATP-binding protein